MMSLKPTVKYSKTHSLIAVGGGFKESCFVINPSVFGVGDVIELICSFSGGSENYRDYRKITQIQGHEITFDYELKDPAIDFSLVRKVDSIELSFTERRYYQTPIPTIEVAR